MSVVMKEGSYYMDGFGRIVGPFYEYKEDTWRIKDRTTIYDGRGRAMYINFPSNKGDLVAEYKVEKVDNNEELLEALMTKLVTEFPRGKLLTVSHDGYKGMVVGYYVTLENKPGLVIQQEGNKVVHVYSTKWFTIE